MLMAYLPREKVIIEADLFDTHVQPPASATPANRSFYNQVQRLKLDVSTIVPIHGKPVSWTDFVKIVQ